MELLICLKFPLFEEEIAVYSIIREQTFEWALWENDKGLFVNPLTILQNIFRQPFRRNKHSNYLAQLRVDLGCE